MKLHALCLAVLATSCLSACKGAEAVEKLGEIVDKTCSCGEDQACIDEATKMAEDWVRTYEDALGGDRAMADAHMQRIIDCSPAVALGFTAGS